MRRSDNQKHGCENHPGSEDGTKRDGFPDKKPSEEQSDNGVDERVSADARSSCIFQKIDLSGETKARAEHDQIA